MSEKDPTPLAGRAIGKPGRVFLGICAVVCAGSAIAAAAFRDWRGVVVLVALAAVCYYAAATGRDPRP